ncbi:hypothetical protein EVAR_49773_1 [Eumeta japonica]|uniref:Uncharacterized protein n=1 Tax=Eumeta variegata TaxID=151549 RepID=A0A4C1Y1C9_EUMVA|nr:hypothetical protein EVAR_49773_1 [Eumeta japonica]
MVSNRLCSYSALIRVRPHSSHKCLRLDLLLCGPYPKHTYRCLRKNRWKANVNRVERDPHTHILILTTILENISGRFYEDLDVRCDVADVTT